MNDQVATQQGAADETNASATPPDPDTQAPVNPRDAVLNAMDEQIHGERIADQKEFVAEHAEELGLQPTVDSQPDGAAAIEPMHPPAEPPAPAPLPDGLDQSPYADYIVMHEGVPHMKAKVHGVDKLIPMERVQAQAQKLEAAEVSMQNAATLQRELRQREEWIRQNETALQSRMDALATQPPPADPGVDDETLITESREIVKTLFSGDEDEAAQKLAGLMKQSRAPAQAAPAIDVTQIATQAAGIAVGQMTEAEIAKDANAGLAQFQQDYPELMADPVLYNIADNMTDVIEQEHPDWKPSQIMLEAGARTRTWLANQKGEAPPGDTPPQPPAGDDPNRQERKDNLVRIPQPALGAVSPHGETEEPVQSPSDALAEIREARGQPV